MVRALEKGRLAAEIAAAYVRVRRLIHRRPIVELLGDLRAGVEDPGTPAELAAEEHRRALRLGRAVTRVLPRLPGDTRCLTQALVLTSLLARRRIGSTLLIAVAPGEDQLHAHAWLEHGGAPVLPGDGPGYGRLVRL